MKSGQFRRTLFSTQRSRPDHAPLRDHKQDIPQLAAYFVESTAPAPAAR